MTELYSGHTSRNVTCKLSGRAPEFYLTLHVGEETWIRPGNWTLDVTTESGVTNITLGIINNTAHSKYYLPILLGYSIYIFTEIKQTLYTKKTLQIALYFNNAMTDETTIVFTFIFN